jgi:hypothetical protein
MEISMYIWLQGWRLGDGVWQLSELCNSEGCISHGAIRTARPGAWAISIHCTWKKTTKHNKSTHWLSVPTKEAEDRNRWLRFFPLYYCRLVHKDVGSSISSLFFIRSRKISLPCIMFIALHRSSDYNPEVWNTEQLVYAPMSAVTIGHSAMWRFFHRPSRPTKIQPYFRWPYTTKIWLYFRRQPTKKRLFSSILFRQSNFVGWPTKIAIFDGIRLIFVGFWPTKIDYFPVV